jgi:hypothetical protein
LLYSEVADAILELRNCNISNWQNYDTLSDVHSRSKTAKDRGRQKKAGSSRGLQRSKNDPSAPLTANVEKRSVGRPPGKKSDPAYASTTIYIRKKTRKAVKHALLEREDNLDLSAVVEQQLCEWLTNQGQTG